jgi:2-polyprenyl-6-methoxyphenol hydroxylase-like FAD-dependent oxidoreductase
MSNGPPDEEREMQRRDYDVGIVGYGPTGMTLAALLGQRGWRVAVLERYTGLYNLPRAACFDDEIMRLFQKLGIADEVLPGTVAQRDYEWVNANGETLVEIHYDDPAPGGWAALYMMYQPHIETVLDRLCTSLPTVDVFRGVSVQAIEACGDGVILTGSGDGAVATVRAGYVVGADGGGSFTRQALGVGLFDYGFQENWLVCDFRKRGETRTVPTFRQVCDPAQPIAIVRIGPDHHRFSFMLDPDEPRERATEERRVWQRVSAYLQPADAELVRVANYVFRSRVVDRWRHGRVMLAGDAAHEMPPFLAQGMCSGMRDSHNLAWKLDLILSGEAGEEILDTYQPEREPHVRFITEKAIELGRVQTLRDPQAARERDERMFAERRAKREPEKLRFPNIAGGLLAQGDAGRHAGEFFVQGPVRSPDAEGLFDDVVGSGPCIVARSPEVLAALAADQLDHWRRIGGRVVAVGDVGRELPDTALGVVDAGGVYEAWFAAHDCEAVIVRPDWYVYGTARSGDELADVLHGLRSSLRAGKTRERVA